MSYIGIRDMQLARIIELQTSQDMYEHGIWFLEADHSTVEADWIANYIATNYPATNPTDFEGMT